MSNFIFGAINDNDEALKGKSGGGKFGLNTGNITKIEFLTDAGKDNALANAVDIWLQVGDREYRRRIYETTGSLYGKGNVLLDPESEGYADLYEADMTQKMAVVIHALKAVGVTQAQIEKILASGAENFQNWSEKVISLVPKDYAKKPVDFFLEYQWKISEGQTKTYPELPKNMKGGRFLEISVAPKGKWSEINDEEGLSYKDDAGNMHAFTRSASYMDSNKGTQQGVDANTPINAKSQTPSSSSDWN